MHQLHRASLASLSFALIVAAGPTLAQDGAPDGLEDDDVITVTGTRQSAFEASGAVTVVTAEGLAGIGAIDDLVTAVPGLSMINDQDPGTNIIALRGVTTDRLQQAAIAFVVDGVALADTEFFTARLLDTQRIEVLKGPQGATLGKNAAGGALQVVSNRPGDTLGQARLAIGDGNLREVEVAKGGAFDNGGRLTWRAAGLWSAADGWIRNRTLDRLVDAAESRQARLTLGWDGDRTALEAGLFWMEDDGGAAWASSGDVTGLFGGKLDGAALTDPIGDFEGRSARRWVQGRVKASFSGERLDLTVVAAHDDYRKRWTEELDYRPGPLTFFGVPAFPNGLQPIGQPTDIRADTVDLRVGFRPDGSVALRGGIFVQDVDRRRTDDFGPLLFGGPAPRYRTDSLQSALSAGLDWRPTERLRVEVDGRVDNDQRRQRINAVGVTSAASADFTRFQPRVGVTWTHEDYRGDDTRPDRVSLYASYGEGFRTGGFNPTPGPGDVWSARYAPEITRSFEVGAKADTGEFRLDLAVFRSSIDDFQSYTFLNGNSVTLTVDGVDVTGLEAGVSGIEAQLGSGWRAEFASVFAIADARIRRYVAPNPVGPGLRDYAGNRVPNAPAWSGFGDVALVGEGIGPAGEVGARFTLNATGETFFEVDNALRAPPKTWGDLQLWADFGETRVSLFARNLTDERWAISAFGQGMLPLLQGLGPGGPFDTFTINRGRQVRVEVSRSF